MTVYAASAVLTSFMGGLALGSWLGGRAAERLRSPLGAFGLVEIGIGLSALAVPFGLGLAESAYLVVSARAPDALPLLTLVRLVGAAAVLLVPTTLMGASLPLVSRHVALSGGAVASRIGLLYAANTTGGIAGTVLAGFVLIGGIGVAATTRLAVAINVLVGLAALGLAYGARTLPAASRGSLVMPTGHRQNREQRAVLAVLGLAGFAGLALEVVWFRILVLFIPATTYAFTTMLGTVLLGIALGSALAAARLPRIRDPLTALARVQLATGLFTLLSMTLLVVSYELGWRTSGMVQACVVAMLPACTLMGVTFPLGLAVWLRGGRDTGRRVGLIYAVNVCGAVAGALAGGFLLLPWFGTRASLLALAALYCAAGWLLIVAARGLRGSRGFAMAAAALWLVTALTLPDIYGAVLARRYGRGERLLFRAEGVQTTATVHFQPQGQRVLYLDGLHQANDSEAMVRVHAEIGHLPMILHPDPRQALVIGLGGGVTAGAVSTHPRTSVDVVELAASVVAAAPFFAHVNGDLLRRPHVTVRVDDGRNYLLTTARRYDVLTADIIQPVHAGAGNLYSREYFALARSVLADGGVMMQWIGHRDEEHYKLIMRTFLDVFPHATLWGDGTLMVGSTGPLQFSRRGYERHLEDQETRFALARVRLDTFDALLARYTAGPDEMRVFAGDGPLLTDDRPLLEYHRSLAAGGAPVDLSQLKGDVAQHVVD